MRDHATSSLVGAGPPGQDTDNRGRPRVGTWFGCVVSLYMSTGHFLIAPRIVFMFVHVSLFRSATCVFRVVTRGVDVAVFYSASCRLEVLTRVIYIPIGSRVLFTSLYLALANSTRVRFLLGHTSVSHSCECPFRTTMSPKPGY